MSRAASRWRLGLIALNLLLAAGQLALFLPTLLAGRDLTLLNLFRVDALGLSFGVAWPLALALIAGALAGDDLPIRKSLPLLLVTAGLLLFAYAANPFVLTAGWLLAGIGSYLPAQPHPQSSPANALAPPLALAAAILLALAGLLRAGLLAPPAGGVSQPWAAPGVIIIALLVVCCAPLWQRGSQAKGSTPLPLLLALAAPYILAKLLVAAPWDAVGAWSMALIGMLMLLAGLYALYTAGEAQGRQFAVAAALVGIIVTGFGLATGSALAGAGAIWLMLVSLLWVAQAGTAVSRVASTAALLASLPGVWLITQGALDTGYGIVAALLLPACALLIALYIRRLQVEVGKSRWAGMLLLCSSVLALAWPQLPLEAIVRPAVTAMPGGVGALSTLGTDWGVGLLVRTPQETISAALPATGMALAVLLAGVALYWLKQLAARLTRSQAQADGAPPE